MATALVLLGSFCAGLAGRRLLEDRFSVLFRAQFAVGVGTLGFLAGWAFEGSPESVAALVVLLAAQASAVLLGLWLWRARRDGPLMAFALWGNPGVWAFPVTAALFGPRAAAWIAVYDMIFQPRVALSLKVLRAGAPSRQRRRTALTDYAPAALTMTGLALGALAAPPDAVLHAVTVLGVAMAASGALMLGIAWPAGAPVHREALRDLLRIAALYLTVAPGIVVVAHLAGLDLPPGAILILAGPTPISLVLFAKLYGYSTRLGATAFTVSVAFALAALPLSAWLAERA